MVLASTVGRAPVRRLHEAWAAARHDKCLPVRTHSVGLANDAAELAGHVVVAAVVEDPLGDREATRRLGVPRLAR
jgi:hypothetical protein